MIINEFRLTNPLIFSFASFKLSEKLNGQYTDRQNKIVVFDNRFSKRHWTNHTNLISHQH